jgi:acyl carrier protein
MDSFFQRASEILEIEQSDESTVLRDCDAWDSLTALSLVAMIDKYYKVSISADDLMHSTTLGDLHRTMIEKQQKA